MHACMHTYVFTYVHAYVFTHAHTYVHVYIHPSPAKEVKSFDDHCLVLWSNIPTQGVMSADKMDYMVTSISNLLTSYKRNSTALLVHCNRAGDPARTSPKKCLAVSMGNTIKIDCLFASSPVGGKVPSLRRLKRRSFPMMKSNRKTVMKMTWWKRRAWMTQAEMTLSLQIFVRWETVWRGLAQFVLTSLSHLKIYTG